MAIQKLNTYIHKSFYIYTYIHYNTCVQRDRAGIVFLHAKRKGNTLCNGGWRWQSLPRQQVPDTRALPGSLITGYKYLTCFYCYFQEHFFYFQEAELRMDVLQQHAALMGGASTTSCPLCHKLFLGSELLVEHMKVHHTDPATVSQAVVQSEFLSGLLLPTNPFTVSTYNNPFFFSSKNKNLRKIKQFRQN